MKELFQYGVDHDLISRNPLAPWRTLKECPRDVQWVMEGYDEATQEMERKSPAFDLAIMRRVE